MRDDRLNQALTGVDGMKAHIEQILKSAAFAAIVLGNVYVKSKSNRLFSRGVMYVEDD